MRYRHRELHRIGRLAWLRAAVLGANDGMISTACLAIGVAAAGSSHSSLVLSTASGLVAGAMSMAAGEYVSVHSQADAEKAALDQERRELADDFKGERRELTGIYVNRGLDQTLAYQVADRLMQHNALDAHARDELGLSESMAARPLLAACASGGSFAMGAALPMVLVVAVPGASVIPTLAVGTLLALLLLGGLAAAAGGASVPKGSLRMGLWSAIAMAVTYAAGAVLANAQA